MISCGCDSDAPTVFIPETLTVSAGTEFCRECGVLIPKGVEHYRVWEYRYDGGDWTHDETETHLATYSMCEACGDLVVSWFDYGFCWTQGDLRNDIAEYAGLA